VRAFRRSAIFAATVCLAAAAAAPASAASLRSGHGLTLVSVKRVDPRLRALVVRTAALPAPMNVWILLPSGYASHPHKRYPVLYLLHGTSGTASDWVLQGDAEKVIGNRQLITVMPDIAIDDGGGGWCSNWPDGAQRWETFHIDQVLPWVDANLRTIPTRGDRAIAGLSQGGFCSLSYAARHPDLFGIALGYSGAPDIAYDAAARVGAQGIINATEIALDHVAPNTFFGDPVTDEVNWAAHDPATLAPNLRATKILMYWGNGQYGPLDTPASYAAGTTIETLVNADNIFFENRIHALRIPAYFDPYGPGTHTWPYWTRDLRWSLPRIMSAFAHPTGPAARFTYTSAENTYSVYGWTVITHRRAREFSTLERAGRRGFALAGSGSATVVTAPDYVPRARYRIRFKGTTYSGFGVLTAGRRGRLRIPVVLGPSNRYQQYTAQAQAAGTAVFTTRVTITRLPAAPAR
jgi:S-formylglutathione hydrolase FrmB